MGLIVTDNSTDEHGTIGSALQRGDLVGLPTHARARGLVIFSAGSMLILDLADFSTSPVDPATYYPEYSGELTLDDETPAA